MGFADWFAFKTPAQRKLESQMFDRWAFPYGLEQREKLQKILMELMPKEDPTAGMAVYLIGSEAYLGSFKADPQKLAERTETRRMNAMDYVLNGQLRGRLKKYLPYYKAMILADANVDENLNYPSIEELKKMAEELA